jgi:hypothetical protein
MWNYASALRLHPAHTHPSKNPNLSKTDTQKAPKKGKKSPAEMSAAPLHRSAAQRSTTHQQLNSKRRTSYAGLALRPALLR